VTTLSIWSFKERLSWQWKSKCFIPE
jgi:hypothetical protein